MAELARHWSLRDAFLSRQYIQNIKRRLEEREGVYRLFLEIDSTPKAIGEALLLHAGRYGSLENLAFEFNQRWQPAFLAATGKVTRAIPA